jgi:hypothetical protein
MNFRIFIYNPKAYGRRNIIFRKIVSPLIKIISKDYLDNAKAWNAEVKRYNENVKQHIELEPEPGSES